MLAWKFRLIGAVFVAAFVLVPLLITASFSVEAQDMKVALANARTLCNTLRALSAVGKSDVSAHCYVGDHLSGDGKVIQAAILEHGVVDAITFELSPNQLPKMAENGLITVQKYRDYTPWNAFKLATYSLFRPDFASKATVDKFYIESWSDPDWVAMMADLVKKGGVKIVVIATDGGYLAMDASPQFYEKVFDMEKITDVASLKGKIVGFISPGDVDIGVPPSKTLISYGEQPGFVLLTSWVQRGG